MAVAESGKIFVVGDDDEGDTLAVEFEEQVNDFGAGDGVKIAGGFVSEDDFGMVDDGAGDTDALFLTTREVVGLEVEVVGETDGFQGLLSARTTVAAADFGDAEGEDDVF